MQLTECPFEVVARSSQQCFVHSPVTIAQADVNSESSWVENMKRALRLTTGRGRGLFLVIVIALLATWWMPASARYSAPPGRPPLSNDRPVLLSAAATPATEDSEPSPPAAKPVSPRVTEWLTKPVPADGSINETQRLQFELMKRSSYNEFDGTRVVSDLLANRHLWRAAMMNRHYDPFLPLRDLEEDHWNVDTLMILSSGQDDGALRTLADTWKADEIGWLSPEDRMRELRSSIARLGPQVLVLWWD